MSKLKLITNWISGSVALLFGLASLAAVVFIGYSQSAQATCVSNWADKYTAVANLRSEVTRARLDALHKLFFDLVNDPQTNQTDVDHLYFVEAVASQNVPRIQEAAVVYAADLERVNPIIQQDILNFQRTEAAYQEALVKNPLPESPKFACERRF